MELSDNRKVVVVDPATYEEETREEYQANRIRTAPNGKTYRVGQFVPGICPNPGGRPKGKSLKQYVREYLASMTDEERLEYLAGMDKDTIWRMAEGNPTEDRNVSITVPTPILGGITATPMLQEGEQTLLEGTQ